MGPSWSNRNRASRTSIPSRSSDSTRPRRATTVSVDAHWTSGVDPCYVLDHVEVHDNGDQTVDVTVIEGTSDPDAICVMMAVAKHTIFSFDVSGPGTWTIRDSQGGAPPVEVVVS